MWSEQEIAQNGLSRGMEGGGDSGWRMQSILATDQLALKMAVGQDSERERGGVMQAGTESL